ncbi:DEAD/DEAH box helicase [Paenibacillaceae bacterium WGS1546]|uniref:DEAD/DEAH box helicase n=1 Tax=Cohnella sp. WGS1546 TaxID=3366810 RepID=UPI00372D6039
MPNKRNAPLPFHPVISAWFAAAFGEPTDVQRRAWRAIGGGEHTLIAAPTGSGKTLAALLPCLDRVARDKAGGGMTRGVRVVYVTPLKALNNDIHRHVLGFADELDALAESTGADWPGIRCEVRTGDTSPNKRASMLRNPPEVLVTTPESLYLLLTSDKGRAILRTTGHVIVDEIHDLAADKRGAHLSLSMERLARLCPNRVQRIGVSATQNPLERVAAFLGGWEEADEAAMAPVGTLGGDGLRPRPVAIVESAMSKRMSIRIAMPDQSKPAATREAVWQPLLELILKELEGCRSALIFVNSRRLCERLTLRLNDHVGYEMAKSHHGSVARERRLEVERLLKDGSLRCIVATSSLELGIDVGHIDLVIQLDSPQEASRGVQRVGRAGHAVGEASRGVLIARNKAALPELAVLGRLIARREIEEIRIPRAPLDVLSQQIVAMTAAEDWDVGELLRLVVRSDSYRGYPREELDRLLQVLAGLYPFAKPLLDWDRAADRLTKRSNTAMAAITGAGTIPQSGNYPVHHLDSRAHLGELDEEFIQESRVGDVFRLGTSSWMIREIRQDRVYVSEAGNRFSEIPFWRNETPSRPFELGGRIGEFLRELSERLGLKEDEKDLPDGEASDEAASAWLQESYAMERTAAEELIGFVRSQHRACALPTDGRIVVEHYKDVMNRTHVIVHNLCGRNVNRAWLLAIERQVEQSLPYKLYGNAKDNGIEFVLPEWDSSWLRLFGQVTPDNVERLLTEAVTGSPLLGIAFRRLAENGLLLSRSFTRTPLWQKRLRSEELLREALPYAESFPFLREAMREAMRDTLGIDELRRLLARMAAGEIAVVAKETPYPSPFAAQFLADYVNTQVYEGDGLDDSIRLQLLNVSKELAGQVFGANALRDAVSPEVAESEERRLSGADRPPGSADELAAALKRQGDMTAREIVRLAGDAAPGWLRRLEEQGKAVVVEGLSGDGEPRWISADERELYAGFPHSHESLIFVLGRYADRVLSFTERELSERYPALTLDAARLAVDRLLDAGLIERAPHAASDDERLWSSAKVASRLVRLTIQRARSRAEPIEAAKWCGTIAALQHAWPGTQLQGIDGLRIVLEKLQGLFLPWSHWESIVLPSRIVPYRREDLDSLCASGEALWIGRKEEGDKEGKVAFFLTSSKPLYAPILKEANAKPSGRPELLKRLVAGGASFLTRLSRDEGRPPSEVQADLMALVWEGRVSNDRFAPLRLQAGKSGDWAKTGSGLGRWYATETLSDDEIEEREREAGEKGGGEPHDGSADSSPLLAWTQHLLNAYGVLHKDLLSKAAPFTWDEAYPTLRKLEEWGVLARGAFIRGSPALQFATREGSEALRQPLPSPEEPAFAVLSAADPANPFGLSIDWPGNPSGATYSRKPGNYLILQGDLWRYWVENNGRKICAVAAPAEPDETVAGGLPPDRAAELLLRALRTVIGRSRLVKIKIDSVDGVPATETDLGARFRKLGAERDQRSLVIWSN